MRREWLTKMLLKWRALVNRRRLERELREEMEFHLAMREERNRTLGLTGTEAQAEARRRFGNFTFLKEDCRELWIFSWAETLWKDIQYATRILAKSPGFAAVVVCSLALGIGANTAVFSVMNAVLLHALPYDHPESLMTIWTTHMGDSGEDIDQVPLADVATLKKANHVFENIGAVTFIGTSTLTGAGEPLQVKAQTVTPEFFMLVGVQPKLGRVFRVEEAQEKAETVIISEALWKTRFHGDAGILGKTFRINDVAATVVGVMPAGFKTFGPWAYAKMVDVWEPINPEDARYASRGGFFVLPVARLKPGVTLEQAQSEMNVFAKALEAAYPEHNKGVGTRVVPIYESIYKYSQTLLYPLVGAVGFVLLIACANVANLMLARTESRRKEYSLRASLGAGRRRLLQQILVESGVLTLLGGCLGLLLSFWGVHLMRAFVKGLPDAENIRIDGRVLLFTAAVSLLTALLFGMAPAAQVARADLNEALRANESRTSTGKSRRTRYVLVICEVALTMVLLVGAGLTLNSLMRIALVSPGFDPTNVLTMAVKFPDTDGKYLQKTPGKLAQKISPKVTAYHHQLLVGAAALPGVESVGMISILPPLGAGGRCFSVRGSPTAARNGEPMTGFNEVSPDYFRTMKIPLERGRYLEEGDTLSTPWVAVISETFASRYFPNEDPIGKQVLFGYTFLNADEERPREIVGVVGEVKQVGMGGLHPLVYESYLQQPEIYPNGSDGFHLAGTLVIRTVSDVHRHEAALVASVKQMMKELDPDVPVTDIQTMDDVLGTSLSDSVAYVTVLGVFAALAAVLAAVGIYGVLSYFVSLRTREIGIRLALGAQRGEVLAVVIKLGLALVGTGFAIGVGLALGLNGFMQEHFWLYEIKTTDPATYAAVGALFLSIALLACYLPARRATLVDPMTILREE